MIPPTTKRKRTRTQNTSGIERILAFHVDRSDLGAIAGLIFAHAKIIPMKSRAMISPGIMTGIKSCPMDCSVRIPRMISVTLGGMMTPGVPTVATIPEESLLSYPYRSISGIATPATVAAGAADEPQMALKAVAPMTVAVARPPGIWPTNLLAASYSLAGMQALTPHLP